MAFISIKFLLFFIIVIGLYYLLPNKFRNIILIIASYYFYMSSSPEYIILILVSTSITYFAGISITREQQKSKKKKYLYFCIFFNLIALAIFKYFNFFNTTVGEVVRSFNIDYGIPNFSLLLPLGISFYTFQILSYIIDVYKGKKEPEKNFLVFALYVSFFPTIVAGPIQRSENIIPQFKTKHSFDYDKVTSGIKRMGIGLFKKSVIADNLAIVVDKVFNNPTEYRGLPLILAAIFFTIEIYCDFSGYSDMAIGASKIMGFELLENFKKPYSSKSVSEFWRRWHISLSTWFRDYVYIPMGGNRVSKTRRYINLFVTFLCSGLWHGANWTFVIWGAIHGVFQILGIAFKPIREKINKIIRIDRVPVLHSFMQIVFTFCLISFAWIFFRANSISDAIYIVKNLFSTFGQSFSVSGLISTIVELGLVETDMLMIFISLFAMVLIHTVGEKINFIDRIKQFPIIIRWGIYYVVIFCILFFGAFETQQFIYAQF